MSAERALPGDGRRAPQGLGPASKQETRGVSISCAQPGAERWSWGRELLKGSNFEAVKVFAACTLFPPFMFPVGKWLSDVLFQRAVYRALPQPRANAAALIIHGRGSTERFGGECCTATQALPLPQLVGCCGADVAQLERASLVAGCDSGCAGTAPQPPGSLQSPTASQIPESAATEYNLTLLGKRCQTHLCARHTWAGTRAAPCESSSCAGLTA